MKGLLVFFSLTKSYLRSKMQQSRLTNLAILSIENKLVDQEVCIS